jgi:dolichyl-phosphate-mannose--protein O-mannosyl transferase
MSYSFMHFAQARLALVDTFGVTFVFISFYYLYKFITQQRLALLLWSGVFFGLAISIKWSAVFASLGFLFIAGYLLITRYPLQKRFSRLNLVKYGFLSYAVVALCVYLLSFFDIFMHGGTLQTVINYNTNMYNYHSTLIASHPYSSPWWSWPLDLKPMGYYAGYNDNLKSSINAFGNPAIFWTGIVAILYLVFAMFKRKSLEAAFILLAFLGLYVPYIFVGRLMFIYHFYYAVPFLILAVVYMFKAMILKVPTLRYTLWIYLVIVVGLFLAFYPVLSGYGVHKSYISEYLVWLPKWWL